ncbi:MAG: dienelactone hydrolase family protein [Woeseiaceae bacterium]
MSELLECIEIDPTNATHSVIWLHGLGADGHDFEPIVNELNLEHTIRFVFPNAPHMPVTINNDMVMPAWYDIKAIAIDQQQDKMGIHKSQQSLLALIEREQQRGIPSNKIILAGFSQGGAIALHTAVRYTQPLAGIMGLSSYLPLVDTVEVEIHTANKATPFFIAHGLSDPIISIQLATKTCDKLNQHYEHVLFKSYPMEHSVCPEEINDISNWINACFK